MKDMTREQWQYGTQPRQPRKWWEYVIAIVLIVGIIYFINRACTPEKKLQEVQQKADTEKKQIQANTAVIKENADATQEVAKNLVKSAQQSVKKAETFQYKPTPSITDSATQYRADVLRGLKAE